MTAHLPLAALMRAELLRTLRLRRTFGLLLLVSGFVFMVSIVMVLTFTEHGVYYAGVAQLAGSLFVFLTFTYLLGAALLIPGLAAACISSEREQGTYDQLHLTLIRPSAVVLAKTLNVLVVFLLLLISTLPLLGVLFFFVGVDWSQFGRAFLLIGAVSASLTAAGVFASAAARTTRNAIGAAYSFMLCVGGLPIGLCLALVFSVYEWLGGPGPPPKIWTYIVEHVTVWAPLVTLGMVWGGAPVQLHFGASIVYQLVLAGLFMAAALCFVRGAQPYRPRLLQPNAGPRVRFLAGATRTFKDGVNPVLTLELDIRRVRRSIAVWTSFCIGLVSFGGATWAVLETEPEAMLGVLFCACLIVTFLFMSSIAPTFAKDHERDTLSLLRGTLLRPGQVFNGKVRAELLGILPVALGAGLGMTPGFLYMLVHNSFGFEIRLVLQLLFLLLAFAYTAGLSVFAAVRCRKTSTAVSSVFLLNVLAQLGAPMLAGVLAIRSGSIMGVAFAPIPFFIAGALTSPEVIGEDEFQAMCIVNFVITVFATLFLWGAAGTHFDYRYRHGTDQRKEGNHD